MTASDPAGTVYTLFDANNPPGSLAPVLLPGADWGDPVWQQQMSGPRSTLGQVAATQQVANRMVTLPIRVAGATKDAMAQNIVALAKIVDLMRRFGGRITFQSSAQTFRQNFDVLGTAGFQITSWGKRAEIRYAADCAAAFVCGPYAVGDTLDVTDLFATDTVNPVGGGDYTFDSGAGGNVAVTGGILDAAANFATENRMIHTVRGYQVPDHQVTVSGAPGTVLTSFKLGAVIMRTAATTYLEAFIDDNGTNSRLSLRKVVAGTPTTLAGPTNLAARVAAGTRFTVRGRIEKNRVFAEYFAAQDPTPATAPTLSLATYILTTAEAAQFGAAVNGYGGLSWIPQETTALVSRFAFEPYTYRAATFPDVFRLGKIPGDAVAPALLDVDIGVTNSGALDHALIGWMAVPVSAVNILDMGDAFGGVATGAWAVAAVANINGAATSITRQTTGAIKFGAAAYEVTAINLTADSGVQRRAFRKFRQGITYTFSVWVQSAASVATVAVRVGNAAANDVATGTSTALSTSWQQLTVQWTPTADRADAHITVIRRTTTAADVFRIDGEQVYEGTVAPTAASQIEGRGAPAPFGMIEAENGVQVAQVTTADGAASAGFRVSTSALVVVDPNLMAPDDLTKNILTEVWARIRMQNDTATLKGVCGWYPLRSTTPDLTYSVDFGSPGRSIPVHGATAFKFARLGVVSLPVKLDRARAAIYVQLSGTTNTAANTGAKLPTANSTDSNGTLTNPANAHLQDSVFTGSIFGISWRYQTFALVPVGTILGIVVQVFGKDTSGIDPAQFFVELADSTGAAKGNRKFASITSTVIEAVTIGSSTDTWGKTDWVAADFNDTNFRLRIGQNTGLGGLFIDAIKVTIYYTSAPVIDIDYLMLVPARARAVTATGVDPPSNRWLPAAASTVDQVKRIRRDLSAQLGQDTSTLDTGGMFDHQGMGGALLEIPSGGAVDIAVKLADLIPDAPSPAAASETLNATATIHFAVTPRYAFIRDQ